VFAGVVEYNHPTLKPLVLTGMKYGFGDEAGDVGSTDGSSHHLVVCILLTDDPQTLRRIVAHTRKGMGKKLKQAPELKAYHTPRIVLSRLLHKLAEHNVEIVTAVWKKQDVANLIEAEDGYRTLLAMAIRRCAERYPHLSLVLDKRYTNPRLRDRLISAVIDGIEPSTVLVLEQSESQREKALQLVDAVAWSIFQKYERGDTTLYDILRGKIVVEEVVEEIKNWLSLGADSHRP
jgi:hypothetical protein